MKTGYGQANLREREAEEDSSSNTWISSMDRLVIEVKSHYTEPEIEVDRQCLDETRHRASKQNKE